MPPPAATELASEVASLEWYHTLELAPGLVTPGWFDTRAAARKVPMPASLAGKRCLDVGTYDGFWAFEMEKRGADEVVGIDVLEPRAWDWPLNSSAETIEEIGSMKARGRGFEVAREALDSAVQRLELSVHDLDRSTHGGFDFVYLGSLLLHLRDPVGALMKIRGVCDGQLLVCDNYDLPLTLAFPRQPVASLDGRGRPWWWIANRPGVVRMIEAAGFRPTQPPVSLFMPPGAGQEVGKPRAKWLTSRDGREQLVKAWRGDPHVAVLSAPA